MKAKTANVAGYLLEGKNPDRVALSFLDRDYSYGSLLSAANRIAGYLSRMGGTKGSRAILVADNSFFWVAAYLGILIAGMVCVPLAADTSAIDLSDILDQTEPEFIFLQSASTGRYRQQLRALHLILDRVLPTRLECASHVSFAQLASLPAEAPGNCPAVNPESMAALMFTSGSTGRPRGVMVSHGNIIANTESIIKYLQLTPDDRIMTILPFHYCFGASLLHTHLRAGASLVVDNRFLYPEAVLNRMSDTACTGLAGVPSHFQILLRKTSIQRRSFPHLRYLQQAGGHLAPNFVRELQCALPNTDIFIMYGQTEATARLAYLPPELLEQKIGSIGKAIPGVKLSVLDAAGNEATMGEYGEIVAEGPSIAQGYWRDPEGTARTFRDGKLHTGDIARKDDEGFLYIGDRSKSFLKCGGRRVSTQQIEDCVLEFDELQEAAVIGIPDDLLGEAVQLYVVSRNTPANGVAERLLQYCRSRMPQEVVPRSIVVLDTLPKNSNGKIMKEALRAMRESQLPAPATPLA
jgi:acyl-CoA synthetase (AMP-forming)/AMP-acid ligase II